MVDIESGVDENDGWEEEEEVVEEETKKRRKRNVESATEDEWEDPIEGLSQMMDSATGADQVSVFRIPSRGNREFVETFDITSFSLPELRNLFGPGKYYIRVRVNGRWKKGGKIVTLAPRNEDARINPAPPRGDGSLAGRLGGGDPLLVLLLERLLDRNEAPRQSYADIMTEMTRGAAAQTTALLTMFQELQAKAKPGGMSEMMDNMRAFMEMKEEFGGGSGDNDGGDMGRWLSMLKPVMPALAQAIAAGTQKQEETKNVGSEVAALPPIPQPVEQPKMTSPLQVLEPYVMQVLEWAKSGQKPEPWAAMVVSMQPEIAEQIGTMHDAYEDPMEFYGELEKLYPDVVQYRTWVERFVNSLLAEDEEEEDEK